MLLIEKSLFYEQKSDYCFVLGEKKENMNSLYFVVKLECADEIITIGIVNDNIGIAPQIDFFKENYLIGNNNQFVIFNKINKSQKIFPVFPVFYHFEIKGNKIVVGELSVLCIEDDQTVWEQNFDEIIGFDSILDNELYLKNYSNELIIIDIISGNYVR